MNALNEHKKRFHSVTLELPNSTITVEGPVSSDVIRNNTFHEGLHAFRPADRQQEALAEIADLPEGRIIVARDQDTIVAYVTFLYPDPLERWSQGHMKDLLELGAIEVAAPWRHGGTAKKLLEVAFMDDAMNDFIVISTEYYWHWDLEGTGLSVWDYKEVMKKVMGSVGMEYFATDDPEITCHPANMLMGRIGSRVPLDSIEQFNELRFQSRYMY